VHTASRIMNVAEPGRVLASSYAQRHRPILVISEPERGATSVIT
jgi:hypothetical protein